MPGLLGTFVGDGPYCPGAYEADRMHYNLANYLMQDNALPASASQTPRAQAPTCASR